MRYAGIDWAEQFHDVAVVDEAGAKVEQVRVGHDAQGVETLRERLKAWGGPAEVLVAIESGAPLLLDQLLEQGYTIYPINPKQADRYRDRHTLAGAKDDRLDAFVLADALRTDRARMRALTSDSPLVEEIRLRDRARTRRIQARAQLMNQLRVALGRYFPALLGLERDLNDPFLLALLKAWPEPTVAARATVNRLGRLVKQHRLRALTGEQVAERLRAPALKAPAHVTEACRDEAVDLAAQIGLLNAQIRAVTEQLEALLERHPDRDLLQSLPGIADVLSARVLAEAGESQLRCADSTHYRAHCGTAPVTRRSGQRAAGVAMRKGCNRRLQSAFFQIALCSLPRSPWAQAYYDYARKNGMSAPKALRALSNKWAKILFAVLTTRVPYDEAQHVRLLRARAVPWAQNLTGAQAA